MDSLLNTERPPVFCPGCSHEKVVHALDKTLCRMEIPGNRVMVVSDIGCSGLFDTFFNTHAMHGLHGRALTYATGLKMARPDLTVIVTMGDGGLGIGGAHVLSTCRRNIDITLLVLNNFNYGMTGGQFSSTTPEEAVVGSGFLNRIEKPMDICMTAGHAGAAHVKRVSTYDKKLEDTMESAVRFKGFSLLDIHGICPGRYTKKNTINPGQIRENLDALPDTDQFEAMNARKDYHTRYMEEAEQMKKAVGPATVTPSCSPCDQGLHKISVLGGAGQRIVTAGELIGLAGMAAGMRATQKNDYPITVLRGHSITELILSEQEIGFTGTETPTLVLALSEDGTAQRTKMLENLPEETTVFKVKGLEMPTGKARVLEADFKAAKIKSGDRALAMLALLAARNTVISMEMLKQALSLKFKDPILSSSLEVVEKAAAECTVV